MRNRRTGRQNGNITGVNSQVAIPCDDASAVFLQVLATAMAGVTFVVEASMDSTNGTDGTWVRLGIAATNATNLYTQTVDTGVLAAQPTNGWIARVVPFRWVRVRCTAWTSGTSVNAILTAFAGSL